MDNIQKEIRDFQKKYQYQYKKFNISIIEKSLTHIKEIDTEKINSLDINFILDELNKKINFIKENPKTPYQKNVINEKNIDEDPVNILETSIKFLKHDIPKEIKTFELRDFHMELMIKHSRNDVIKDNYKKMIDLKESRIIYMIQYCVKTYRLLPSLIKKKKGGEE